MNFRFKVIAITSLLIVTNICFAADVQVTLTKSAVPLAGEKLHAFDQNDVEVGKTQTYGRAGAGDVQGS